MQNLVHLDDDGAGRVEEPSACVRIAVRDMLFADDAGIVSKSAEGLARTMAVIVTVFEATVLTVSAKKTETMLLQTRSLASRAPPFVIEAAGQRYKQTMKFMCLGGLIHEDDNLMVGIDRPVRLMRACYNWLDPKPYDMTTAPLSLKVRVLKTEVIETLLRRYVA